MVAVCLKRERATDIKIPSNYIDILVWTKRRTGVRLLQLYLRFVAGSTQAAEEAVDGLNGAENHLQTADCHQSAEESGVELHHVRRLGAH